MNQISTFPQISARGHFDLWTGKTLNKSKPYTLYPKNKFDKINNADEIVIFVHGMRNSRWGAKRGALTLRQTLRKLGYKKHPVVAFSYDADIRGAHIMSKHKKVIEVAEGIAKNSGILYLPDYIHDLKRKNPNIKIRLVGHSLGCEVVLWAVRRLGVCSCTLNHVESVHLFGSPLELGDVEDLGKIVKVTNYYNQNDDVIIEEVDMGNCKLPTCLIKKVQNVKNVKLLAEHHGFRAYASKLRSFP